MTDRSSRRSRLAGKPDSFDPGYWDGTVNSKGLPARRRALQSQQSWMTDAEQVHVRKNKLYNIWGGEPRNPEIKSRFVLVRPHPVYAQLANGKLVHRIRFVIGRQVSDGMRYLNEMWCGGPQYWQYANQPDTVYPDAPDFVCKKCEDRAVAYGHTPSLAFSETGCEAWHGQRFRTGSGHHPECVVRQCDNRRLCWRYFSQREGSLTE